MKKIREKGKRIKKPRKNTIINTRYVVNCLCFSSPQIEQTKTLNFLFPKNLCSFSTRSRWSINFRWLWALEQVKPYIRTYLSFLPISNILTPSIDISPSAGSTSRKRDTPIDDFPEPVLPTMPIFSLAFILQVMPFKTNGKFSLYRI